MARGKNILVPVDFSEKSMVKIDQAVYTAKVVDAEVTLMHAVETYSVNSSIAKEKYEQAGREAAIEKAVEEKLDEIIAKIKDKSIVVHKKIAFGKIYQAIIDVADEINARLIIMGTTSTSRLGKIMGTNTSRVVRAAKCPVITMRDKSRVFKYKNILLPLDFSKETRQKVQIAIETAHQFGSHIHVMSVMNSSDEFHVSKLRAQLNVVKQQIKDAGVPFTAKLIKGKKIAETILNYAPVVSADCIFIMTQQEVGFVEMMVGTSAEQVMNNAMIPVISVRPAKGKESYYNIFG